MAISKGSGPFVHPHHLEATFEHVVTYLTDRDQLRSVPTEQYAVALARAYNAVNAVHAFREGNGRTQREFTNAIAHQAATASTGRRSPAGSTTPPAKEAEVATSVSSRTCSPRS